MQWTCQLVVKTGTPTEGELVVLLQGGVVTFVSWGSSPPIRDGWISLPLLTPRLAFLLHFTVMDHIQTVQPPPSVCMSHQAYRSVFSRPM